MTYPTDVQFLIRYNEQKVTGRVEEPMGTMEMCTIVEHIEIAEHIYELTLKGELVQRMKEPGQFVHVRVSNDSSPLLRRPLSIASIDHQSSQFKLIYRIQGKGTSILATRQKGEKVNILGPLGHGFPIFETKSGQTALIIGGGIGVPPLFELSSQLVKHGAKVMHILGYQTSKAMFYTEKFEQLGQTLVATEDGSYGVKGYVTHILSSHPNLKFDTVYACGPHQMLAALKAALPHANMFISLEERMGCGIGACYSCICPASSEMIGEHAQPYKKICSDGPVFAAREVIV